MIRTTVEAPFFAIFRNPALLAELARPEYLTTARYEPILRRSIGSGHVDLIFETPQRSCVLGAIRLDPSHLLTRERSPFIWPAALARAIDHDALAAIERSILPWLRSIARAQPMAAESIRRFRPSERFDRARQADLVGAAPLERSMLRLAPFIYARRFVANAAVSIGGVDAAVGYAVLSDIASSIERIDDDAGPDDAFACAWYGIPVGARSARQEPDVVVVEKALGFAAAITIETQPVNAQTAGIVEVPSPAPWDVLFPFDGADAPVVSRFAVHAAQPLLRDFDEIGPEKAVGGSSGTIVLALSVEALTQRSFDVVEAELLGRRLMSEGFRVHITSDTADVVLAQAQLLHIFGARFEPHTIAFAEFARGRGIEYVFDLPPVPGDKSTFLETTFTLLYRAALDDADIARYTQAYNEQRLDFNGFPQTSADEYAQSETRFAQLAGSAAAILANQDDLELLRAELPPGASGGIVARGVFAETEPAPDAIGHIVPRAPYAFVHASIAAQSHCLYAAVAAEKLDVPLVIAGPLYDIDYLQILRGSAPNAIILADARAPTVSALYRSSTIWVDAAPRPRSAAGLLRAVACGALPVVPERSPLARITAGDAPVFSLSSLDECARTMRDALRAPDRRARVESLRARLLPRRDPASTFACVIAAYSRVASVA